MSTQRASVWSLTINNPTTQDEEYIALARQRGWKVEGQKEVGKEGTLHYQLVLRTPQVRFSAVKKAFPRAHIEVARNVAVLDNYVHKEDTRVAQLPTSQDKYPSLSKFWQLVYHKLSTDGPAELDIDWFRLNDRKRLDLFDQACEDLIYDGYHIETIAVNPQTRTAFAKFARSILHRAYADRQTDRHALDSQEVNLPEIHNNALDEETDSTDSSS